MIVSTCIIIFTGGLLPPHLTLARPDLDVAPRIGSDDPITPYSKIDSRAVMYQLSFFCTPELCLLF